MRWRTAHHRAARRARFSRRVWFDFETYSTADSVGVMMGHETLYLIDFDVTPAPPISIPADFQDQIAAIMNVPARYLFNREYPINPERYRKD